MNPNNSVNDFKVWEFDQLQPDPSSTLTYLFTSPRIGGMYKIIRKAAINLQNERQRVGPQEADRLEARLATLLVNRIRRGELLPVVNAALVEYVCEKTKPLSVTKRARRLLRFLVESTNSIDQIVDFSQDNILEGALGSSESTSIEELDQLLQHLRDIGLIERTSASGWFRATIQGFETIEQEDASLPISDEVFVALWFDESTNEFRSSIEYAIRQSGYEPFIVDDKAFDGLIDDAIVAGIRSAKFVVADLTHGKTGMRGSVYYEAGFARGQEKSVILTARQDHVDSQKIAFDLNHYPIISWAPEDLPKFSKELQNRIEALYGQGPGATKV